MRRSTVNTQRPGTTLKFEPASTRPPISISERRAASGVTRKRVRRRPTRRGQPLQTGHDANGILERVSSLMEQPDMGLAPVHGHSHRERPPVRVPDDAARGFRREHPDAVRAQALRRRQKSGPRRPPVSSSGTNTSPTRPSSGTRNRFSATAAYSMEARPPFMSAAPRPKSVRPFRIGVHCPGVVTGTTS